VSAVAAEDQSDRIDKRRSFPLAFREEVVETLERMRATGERARIGAYLASRGIDHHVAARWTKALRGVGSRCASMPRVDRPRPKNGSDFVGLLGGGPGDIYRELRVKLDQDGIRLEHHREYGRSHTGQGPIPNNVDLVILLIDMLGHSAERGLIVAAKRAGVPYIRSTRKMSTLLPQLIAKGFVDRAESTSRAPRGGVAPLPAPAPSPLPPVPVTEEQPRPARERRDAPPAPSLPPAPPESEIPAIASEQQPILTDRVGETVASFVRQIQRWMPASGITEITITRTGMMLHFADGDR
jgi:hypothetical protein